MYCVWNKIENKKGAVNVFQQNSVAAISTQEIKSNRNNAILDGFQGKKKSHTNITKTY